MGVLRGTGALAAPDVVTARESGKLTAMAPNDLLDAALALPPEERLELASKLLAGVEDAQTEEWSGAWLAECDDRMAAFESGAEPSVPWDAAYARLRAGLPQR